MRWLSFVTLLIAATALLSACPSARFCEALETCNGLDDDCDDEIDEDYRDDAGRFTSDKHCGSCAVACDEVFPSARDAACVLEDDVPICRLVSCRPGFHLAGEGACIPDETSLCLPCEADEDCAARMPGALCLESEHGRRCGQPCGLESPCPAPFACDATLAQCLPAGALCACSDVETTFEVACLVPGKAAGQACAGVRTCGPMGLSDCVITAQEICNGVDDDCDGEYDEDFRNRDGVYVGPLHCGGCGMPCAPPGPNYEATCWPGLLGSATCNIACEPTFVDVDGIRANGCECQIQDGTSAPVTVGGDADCDGVVDDDDTFVHVTSAGSDTAEGTLIAPVRSIEVGITRAQAQGKSVLVAQGVYPPFAVVAGVSVFGGYRSDFRDRDPELYPVVVQHNTSADGNPVLRCRDVQQPTTIDGITFVGQDAQSAGRGSTTLHFSGCSAAVKLANLTVLSGSGADGRRGDDASERLPPGTPSLSALDGKDGSAGRIGDEDGTACVAQAGGAGGQHSCGAVPVSGGLGGASSCGGTGCINGSQCGNAGCSDFTTDGVCDYEEVLRLAVANPSPGTGLGTQPGAAGALTYNSPTNRGICSFCDDNPTLERTGQDGRDGRAGTSGAGGAGCGFAQVVLDGDGRGTAGAGNSGFDGSDGSGGGGGSAGAGIDVIARTDGADTSCDDNAGGSGGGAGSGGCGAPGGGAGNGGGASIGIVVQLTTSGDGPTFSKVRVVTESGGRGGDGGIGAEGGAGGSGASGGRALHWCARNGGRGGDGGAGGAGGGGGGGCGGASHALAVRGASADGYRSKAAVQLMVEQAGVAGLGGRGGFSPRFSGQAGEPGSSAPIL
jgi:hypothetical protein